VIQAAPAKQQQQVAACGGRFMLLMRGQFFYCINCTPADSVWCYEHTIVLQFCYSSDCMQQQPSFLGATTSGQQLSF
jgi:hypothetical protein